MTMDMRRFQVLFDSHNRNESEVLKDPNILAAEKAGAMSSMGYYEKEFTVYGCCFYKEGERRYIISGKAEKIISFLENEANKMYFPTPMEHWTTSALVPSGTEDMIVRMVKKQLAQRLAQQYPEEYFLEMRKLFSAVDECSAEQILQDWQENLEGLYDETSIQLFETALTHARNKRIVTELYYYKMQQWIIRNRQDMLEDIVKKSTYIRTLYGYSYIKPDGEYGYYMNARKDSAYDYRQRQIEKGIVVTPMISKTYSFKENVTPQKAKEKFEIDLPKIFTETYWGRWNAIREIKSPIFLTKNCKDIKTEIDEKYGAYSAKAFQGVCVDLDAWQ